MLQRYEVTEEASEWVQPPAPVAALLTYLVKLISEIADWF